jgi:hypothetical protein
MVPTPLSEAEEDLTIIEEVPLPLIMAGAEFELLELA